MSASAQARDLGDSYWSKERFQIRLRAIDIIAEGSGTVEGTALGTDLGDAVTPEIDFTYFLNEHWALELIAATAQHQVNASGDTNLGDVWILPPTLTLQYHFMPDSAFSPYIGAGINYSLFYGEEDGSGFSDLDVDNAVGPAVQAGFDYWVSDNWGLNLDVKYVDIDTDVKVNSGGTRLQAKGVDVDPIIAGVGMSFRF